MADELNAFLAKARDVDDRAALAAELTRTLEAHLLDGLEDAHGRSCRAEAVGALLALGFPYALQVDPDDLDFFRAQTSGRKGRWALAGTTSAVAAAAGFHASSLAGLGLGLSAASAAAAGGVALLAFLRGRRGITR